LKAQQKLIIMKTMTCKQLGGACDQTFRAATFEEMASLSNEHGKEMFKKNDDAHLEAMRAMQLLIETPNAMQDWFEEKKQAFNALPED
jgi:hypothetical protein